MIRKYAVAIGVSCLAATAGAEPNQAVHVLHLVNGDTLHVLLTGVRGEKVSVRPVLAEGQQIELSLASVEAVEAAELAPDANGPPGDRMEMDDGTVLVGQFQRLAKGMAYFDIPGSGAVQVPMDRLCSIVREGFKLPEELPATDKHIVIAGEGKDVLVGTMGLDGTAGVVVDNQAFKLRAKYDQIRAIVFPQRDIEPNDSNESAPVRRVATVQMGNGMVLNGTGLQIAGGRASLAIDDRQRVTVPVNRIAGITFAEAGGLIGGRRVLVWGPYADTAEEYPRTLEAMKKSLPAGWRINESTTEKFDAAFRRELLRCRTLLIPEMEKWNGSRSSEMASQLRPIAAEFLRRGGVIVLLGPSSGHVGFFREAGLIELQQNNSVGENTTVTFTAAGKWLSKGVGAGFQATNSTMAYSWSDDKIQPLAGDKNSSPCVAKRVGRGWVIVMGMDFYGANEGTTKMLGNAVSKR